jgi:hypothetical protein
MMKLALVLLSGVSLGLAFGTPAHAQLPKEGTYTSTHTYGCTFKIAQMGEERSHGTYECLGVTLADSDDAPLHGASSRCLGAWHTIKGAWEDSGSCVLTRPDKDQAFMRYSASGKTGVGGTGPSTFVGGTGKLAGITGGGESTGTSLRSTAPDNFHGYSKSKVSYKLP